jgi:hypothetical protein
MPVELHPHQEEAVEKMHNGCVLYGGVGVGKTITSLGYYFTKVCGGQINKWGSMETPKDVYVITTAKVRDSRAFELQAAQYGVHTDPAISTNGVKITVDSWNNLKKYVEVENAFFIFDEQRVVGYGAWSRAFIKVAKHNEWVLLSATPGDTWMDYIPVFIANGWYKHKTDFIDQHVIWTPRVKYPKVLRYQNIGVLVRRRNSVLVHMPVERHTVRHHVDVWCDYDEQAFEKAVKKRWHVFEERPIRDVSELFSVMRKVVNSSSDRMEHLRSLMEKHPKLIVFYNFDYELEMLRSLANETQSSTTVMSQSSSSPDSSDPLIGTIWEEGFDEALGKVVKDDTAQSTGLSSSNGQGSRSQHQESTGSGSQDSSFTDDCMTQKTSRSSFAVAEWNGHKHEAIPATDRWVYLVQYRAGAEGWNCVDTDAMVFWSQTYSYRDWWQAHGRIDRINTPFTDLWYYHFVSRSIIDKAIRKALKVKKSFNERDLHLEGAKTG